MIMSQGNTASDNNNNNSQPQSFEEFQELQKQQAKPASLTQPTQYDEKGNAIFPQNDNLGRPNKSRGIIGVVQGADAGIQNNKQNKFFLGQPTEGTIADRINSPINYEHIRLFNNTSEAMIKRIEDEKKKGTLPPAYQEQIEIKRRTEMQGAQYKPPVEFEGLPGLEPTPEPKPENLGDTTSKEISITDEEQRPNVVEQIGLSTENTIDPSGIKINPSQIKSGIEGQEQQQDQSQIPQAG